MKEEYRKWHSPHLNQECNMLVFGHGGMPLVLFPTSQGRYYQNKDEGMLEAARWFVDEGKVRIYCPDSIDHLSWYNKDIPASARAYNQTCYDRMVLEEIVLPAQQETGVQRIATAGCSFGGYHAVNFAFRHPETVSYVFSMSGIFDISRFAPDGQDDNVYFNNPMDYIKGDNDPHLWRMGIVLGCGEQDVSLEDNRTLSRLLGDKNISHWLDVRAHAVHDWPLWRQMFPQYLSLLLPSY
ncbi:esterase family protein [Dinghuibacter silviterrae]|uniref:Esterase/lipase superfamily enzyme n=1 Tax=Dinghuibacter silviterrae TaxID=1539049 RepID=A0A4V3GLV2_9BACT|nr:alpha/beta hydrolase-fold protein [Dinghuibacter silviterrae]TDX01043.1 esterase/lipase superfamily enzyme [Dinghuibacter silviterrae]